MKFPCELFYLLFCDLIPLANFPDFASSLFHFLKIEQPSTKIVFDVVD